MDENGDNDEHEKENHNDHNSANFKSRTSMFCMAIILNSSYLWITKIY